MILRLIRMQELPSLVGYKRSSLYQKMKDGTFPQSIKLGPRAVAWRSTEIDEWISKRESVN